MSIPKGPLGIDPLQFSVALFGILLFFVLYLLLPRALRKQYFGAYPRRHAWSARSRMRRSRGGYGQSLEGGSITGASSIATGTTFGTHTQSHRPLQGVGLGASGTQGGTSVASYSVNTAPRRFDEEQVVFGQGGQHQPMADMQQNEEIVISAAMQQLRDPGVLIVAHGSRGKPKTVRLQLTEAAVTWRTETRKKGTKDAKPKMGKLHQVPLSHIMYVDVGKQTTALRRVENASVSDALCFSLLTKEGSLDLEANSPRERDALVSCFSLVLDEVHAQNWRDIYRGPSSDMPSSFDELDQQQQQAQGGPGVAADHQQGQP
mmetsp:Transcript_33168/g.51442  ORF Transcript_33168/g.51442 Transcript_33168/m.51442 type:complete len:318 (-) Transcript_33168:111-1064(-)|eukprot:CAMPEP_0117047484 /NCGR_PEP_ID=MMETSP0472-20121206/32816_1 /TAXON_ID=693140 ORGANISM="Tiarina fusus, Strain LIS" /NCGR_SAMPLE_ID=MMETSP0472 /ASSEMBLY_ACC=CAM_ASM_000603 /LENGTH=317 /DNA_ID=CAMNT_0004760203 /DNA_START=193 /DNA_END=1146 /DNA_ORIENTATION=+